MKRPQWLPTFFAPADFSGVVFEVTFALDGWQLGASESAFLSVLHTKVYSSAFGVCRPSCGGTVIREHESDSGGCRPTMTGVSSDPERRMRAYIAAWNDHDPESVVEFLSDDCDQYSREGLRDVAEAWFRGFPDLSHEIEELVADEKWVLARLTLRGTHRGPFKGIPATGNKIEIADHVSTRFEAGRIVEHHATADFSTLFEQLGVPGHAPAVKAENKALLEQYFKALNERDKAAFKATLSEEFTYGDLEGPEEMAEMDWRWLEAMDLTWQIDGMHVSEDFVTTRLTVTGTHQGEILGLEPTGNTFEIPALTLSLIEDGEIVEWFGQWDFAGMLNQLGITDTPGYND